MRDNVSANAGLAAGYVDSGAGQRASAAHMIREMANRKRREADQLDGLAEIASNLEGGSKAEQALWGFACGYLK